MENAYGVRDEETRVTGLLWRVPTTTIALSDWSGVPEGFETSWKAHLIHFEAEADSDEEV